MTGAALCGIIVLAVIAAGSTGGVWVLERMEGRVASRSSRRRAARPSTRPPRARP